MVVMLVSSPPIPDFSPAYVVTAGTACAARALGGERRGEWELRVTTSISALPHNSRDGGCMSGFLFAYLLTNSEGKGIRGLLHHKLDHFM